jgi:hypothetical protein
MTTLDLTVLKSQLQTSATNFATLSQQLSPQITATVSTLAPEVATLQAALGPTATSLSTAASSVGTSIQGLSLNSLPSMEKVLKGLVPDMSSVKKLVDSATASLKSVIMSVSPALTNVIARIGQEADTVTTNVSGAVTQLTTEQQQGPLPLPAMIQEMETIYSTQATYDELMAAYIFDPVTNTMPSFNTETLGVDQLLETARSNKDSAVDLTSGSINQAIYRSAAMVREVSSRAMTKAMLYDKGAADAATAALENRGSSGKSVSQLRSTAPEQSEGI